MPLVIITDGRFVGRGEFGDEGLEFGVDVDVKWRWWGEEEENDDVGGGGGGGGGGDE